MRIRKTWGVLGALGIIVSGVVVEAASGGFTARSVSAMFTGTVTDSQTKPCGTGHQDHGTYVAVIAGSTDPAYQNGDVITIHSTSTLAANGEGYTVGDVKVEGVRGGKQVEVGEGNLEATNTSNGLLDGFILGHLNDNGTSTHQVVAENFWVQFTDATHFKGAFGDGPSGPTDSSNGYNRDSQNTSTVPGANDTDNHAVVTSGDC